LSPESGDGHIKDLANRIRMIEKEANNVNQAVDEAVYHELKRISSTDEQEEVEK
jgi:cation transport protein ChaC